MTARHIIEEIGTLPAAEQQQILFSLQQRLATVGESSPNQVRYLTKDEAAPMIKEVLAEHSELFRKLAQ